MVTNAIRSRLVWVSCLLTGFGTLCGYPSSRTRLIDPKATLETRALYHNLHKLARKHIPFGHQHATE